MKYALMILQLVPVLIDIIKKLEEIMPESGRGAEKLAMLRTILAETYPDVMTAWDAVAKIVGVIVSMFNKHDVFAGKKAIEG